jgi:crotonobetainyl-CoA:carnitine CoA-transferase CaiB-like acyl-CoA transferase
MAVATDDTPAKGAVVTGKGPLDGIQVVDFTRIVSGPLATQTLGDLGADVVKVERAPRGEDARPYGVTDPTSAGPGATFLALNRNKRSIGLDMKTPAGVEVATKLLHRTDVAIHNFRPGVMERLGLDYATISADNPGIVYCEITGYGKVGPQRETAANDLAIQGYSGLLGITGEADGPPVRVPTPVSDSTAGLFATIGILAALLNRQSTGLGQLVETNMFEGQVNMLNYMFVDYWLNGVIPQRMGTGNRMGLPNQAFPSSDGWVCIIASNDRKWTACCAALDVPRLAEDPRFATLAQRYQHREELAQAVAEVTRTFTTDECLRRLRKGGIPCAPVNSVPTVADDAQLAALGTVVEMTVEGVGPVKLIRGPLHFSRTPTTERLAPPALGSSTDAVLEELGYGERAIADLRSQGTVC